MLYIDSVTRTTKNIFFFFFLRNQLWSRPKLVTQTILTYCMVLTTTGKKYIHWPLFHSYLLLFLFYIFFFYFVFFMCFCIFLYFFLGFFTCFTHPCISWLSGPQITISGSASTPFTDHRHFHKAASQCETSACIFNQR